MDWGEALSPLQALGLGPQGSPKVSPGPILLHCPGNHSSPAWRRLERGPSSGIISCMHSLGCCTEYLEEVLKTRYFCRCVQISTARH